jgi:hypothetical protein
VLSSLSMMQLNALWHALGYIALVLCGSLLTVFGNLWSSSFHTLLPLLEGIQAHIYSFFP